MTPIQLCLSWYVFIGLIWGYLLSHEYITGKASRFAEYWNSGRRLRAMTVVLGGFLLSIVAWPYSLISHASRGKLRDLFV